MKIILLKSVTKVGHKDDIIDVADGFAQHSLFPKKLAIAATPAAIARLKQQQQNTRVVREVRHKLLDAAIQELNAVTLRMKVKANDQGSLFSKIHASDIVNYLSKEHHIDIDESNIQIPDIKKLGSYKITVSDEGYTATVTIDVI